MKNMKQVMGGRILIKQTILPSSEEVSKWVLILLRRIFVGLWEMINLLELELTHGFLKPQRGYLGLILDFSLELLVMWQILVFHLRGETLRL